MRASVIIPTRDRLDDLTKCLHGLRRQLDLSLLQEIIVVDDHSSASPSAFREVLSQFPHLPIILTPNRLGRGAAAARNYAASLASGDVLAFLDDDAIPAPDWSQVIANTLPNSNVNAITGRILARDPSAPYSRARQLRYDIRQRNALLRDDPVLFMAGGNSAIWRTDFESVGGFDLRFQMMHDRELALRLAERGLLCRYVHDLVIHHRNHKGIGVAYRQSFRSAYYQLQLEAVHQGAGRWSLRREAQALASIIAAGRTSRNDVLPALLACTTEAVHALGCIWYSSRSLPILLPPNSAAEEMSR